MNCELKHQNFNSFFEDNFNLITFITKGTNGSITSQIGNINIENGINSTKSLTSSKSSSSLSKSKDKVYDYQETAASSNLNIGIFTVAQNLDGSYQTQCWDTFKTISGWILVAGLILKQQN